MSAAPLSGRCLCGAITFTARSRKNEMDACHCSFCRRWSGGSLMTVTVDDLAVQGEDKLGVYGSSDWAERCFCKECGSTLFWRMRDGSLTTVAAQPFDNPEQFAFHLEIFIDEKPANYAFANDTRKMTGAEVFAAFSGGAE